MYNVYSLADLKGVTRDAPPSLPHPMGPNPFIFMQLSAKK